MNFPNKVSIAQDVNLYVVKTDKFKTFSINFFIHRPLDDNATKNALIPLVLRRGTQKLKTAQEISQYLEELYGAIFDCGVAKKGERHLMRFHIESANIRGLDANIFDESMSFLCDIMLNPVKENEAFKHEYVSQEKETLRKIIESRINNKMTYAMERCIEEMCKGEPYSIYEYGSVEDLDPIDSAGLYSYYKEALETSPIDIFIVGNIKDEDAVNAIKKYFNPSRREIIDIPQTKINKHIQKAENVQESMDIGQGKLCIGFRTNISYDTEDYYKLALYSNILGGGVTSKLFMNVREKHSLAYHISSRLDKFKGLMLILGGIDFDKYNQAIEIIFEQIEEMKKGNITDQEYDSAVKGISTSIRSLGDSHLYIVDFFLSQILSNSRHTFEEFIDKISSIKKDEISSVSDRIELDTTYFLKNK